ncbi:MAG: acyl-CoA thioesterase [Gemmatimonadaceae bacterium]
MSGPPSSPAPFEHALRVSAADLDERAHVNNVVYVRWVQDVAVAHWRALASPEAQEEIAWVALRHEIDYLSPAVLGDELTVRTWVGRAEGLSFERFTEVRRAGDGRVLARARTLWCPVDARSGRPRRVGPEVRAQFSTTGGGAS